MFRKIIFWVKVFLKDPIPVGLSFVLGFFCAASSAHLDHRLPPPTTTSRPAAEPTPRPSQKLLQEGKQELNTAGLFLGAGSYGFNGPGHETMRVPSAAVTRAVDPLVIRKPLLSNCAALVSNESVNFKKHGFFAPFMASQDIMNFSGLRPVIGELQHKYESCLFHLNEIKLYTFSRPGYIITVPKMVILESEVVKAGERLTSLSEAFREAYVQFQPYRWLTNKNKEIKELNVIFDNSIEKIFNLRFEITIANFKKKITEDVRFVTTQQVHNLELPVLSSIGDPDSTTPLLNDKEEEKSFLILFVDFARRGFSEFHWRSSCPGSFYQRTPFFWPSSHNSDLIPRTFSERKNLIRQELLKTSFATLCGTGEKFIDFCRTCGFQFYPETRRSYQLQMLQSIAALRATGFPAPALQAAMLAAQSGLSGGLLGPGCATIVAST